MPDASSIIGFTATAITALSFLPQVRKCLRDRSCRDISSGMYLLAVVGMSLWITYGLMLKQWPIVACNLMTLLCSMLIILMKFKESRKSALNNSQTTARH